MDIMILTAAAMIGAGLYAALIIPIVNSYRVFHAGIAVDAVITARREKKGRAYLTWSYTVNGTSYSYTARKGRNGERRREGDRGALLLKKGRPQKVYELTDPEKRFFLSSGGAILIMCGLFILCAQMI